MWGRVDFLVELRGFEPLTLCNAKATPTGRCGARPLLASASGSINLFAIRFGTWAFAVLQGDLLSRQPEV
jgi:hypothetical protein